MMTLVERLNAYEKLMRLDKPIGILLLLWPTLWALWISSFGNPNWAMAWVFIVGVVLMRSAGCVFNDFADRKFDPLVERTKDRLLASGQVSSKEALMLAGTLALIAFLLILRFNTLTILLSVAALFLAVTYPYTKRFFALPQAYLGVAFGFGIVMVFAASYNTISRVAWVLLVANIFWSLAYDTEYAMVDREDDKRIGIKTSALTFGKYDVVAVMLCQLIFLGILAYIGVWVKYGVFYFLGLLLALVLVVYQYTLIQHREPSRCFKAFLNNAWLGGAIFIGLVFDSYFKLGLNPAI
jgi:4-hydroxybenzoate polyprenyltransferase